MSTTPPHLTEADPAVLADLLAAQRQQLPELRRRSAAQRAARLQAIADYLNQDDNKAALLAALQKDFRKPAPETLTSELGLVLSHIKYIRKHLRKWMQPKRIPYQLSLTGIRAYIHKEPKGCALIIAPWNYPFSLTLTPLVYAIAAGCSAMVKPSEFSAATTDFIRQMCEALFTPEEVKVVTGGGETSARLTTLPFDHIFFTGSPAIGKKVMAAAAANLTSVTLELGGKSPAVIDRGIHHRKSARNTAWGKFFNAGQTCIAPDYLLVPADTADDYMQALVQAVRDFYGPISRDSPDFARIINERHYDRLMNLLQDATEKGAVCVCGGDGDRAENYIAPTILKNVTMEMDIMQEEIFGPLFPVLTYRSLDEAVAIIQQQPKPLAFYIQSDQRQTIRHLLAATSAGGTLVNEYLLGGGIPAVPFGGVNNSGIGKSFGYHGFVEFTNERSVMERRFLSLSVAYPPYTARVRRIIDRIYRWL